MNINDTKYAKRPSLVYDNPRIQELNEVISKQIEEMVLLVVRGFHFHFKQSNLNLNF